MDRLAAARDTRRVGLVVPGLENVFHESALEHLIRRDVGPTRRVTINFVDAVGLGLISGESRVRVIGVGVLRDSLIDAEAESRRSGTAPLGEDLDYAVGRLTAVQRRGRGAFQDLDAFDRLGTDVVQTGRCGCRRADVGATTAVVDADTVHVHHRLVRHRETARPADADPRARARDTARRGHGHRRLTSGQRLGERLHRRVVDARHVYRGNRVAQLFLLDRGSGSRYHDRFECNHGLPHLEVQLQRLGCGESCGRRCARIPDHADPEIDVANRDIQNLVRAVVICYGRQARIEHMDLNAHDRVSRTGLRHDPTDRSSSLCRRRCRRERQQRHDCAEHEHRSEEPGSHH